MEIEQKIHTLALQATWKRNSVAQMLNSNEGDAIETLENVDDLEKSEAKIKELRARLDMQKQFLSNLVS